MIVEELKEGGFEMQSLWSDLTGIPFREDSEWIGVVAQQQVLSRFSRLRRVNLLYPED
jgi:hypothetical protein